MSENKLFFVIDGENKQKLEAFQKAHEHCWKIHPDVLGAQFTYSFTPHGLGTTATVRCSCGAEEDLSETDLY